MSRQKGQESSLIEFSSLSNLSFVASVELFLEYFALSQAGVYTIDEGWNLYDIINDPEKISKQLAEQKPAWKPGMFGMKQLQK